MHLSALRGDEIMLKKVLDSGKVHVDCKDEVSLKLNYTLYIGLSHKSEDSCENSFELLPDSTRHLNFQEYSHMHGSLNDMSCFQKKNLKFNTRQSSSCFFIITSVYGAYLHSLLASLKFVAEIHLEHDAHKFFF